MIERDFDIPFVADLALREKQIQQNYRPVIAVHKWFARRPGTLFRALLLSEFVKEPLRESFYRSNNLAGIRVADPFMGGGTPLLEANRLGCDVFGADINPVAYWIVREEIQYLDLDAYRKASDKLRARLEEKVGELYRTTCLECGLANASVKYFLWVKVLSCVKCGHAIDLFPGHLIAENRRHPKNVLVCSSCGELHECDDRQRPGNCRGCGAVLRIEGAAKRNRVTCPECQAINSYPNASQGPPKHRMFAIEYYCPPCKVRHSGRFFKKPDPDDLSRVERAESALKCLPPRFIPGDGIPAGDETDRLHRWGYTCYREMFNARQLLGLELSCRLVARQGDDRIRAALATNLSDLLRYQNMLCRYDTMALKSLDIFSVHGFPVGLVQCESNLLGILDRTAELSVGSGGWSNIIQKYARAKAYCERPFEIRHLGKEKVPVAIKAEWIGEHRGGQAGGNSRKVDLRCQDSVSIELADASLDGVFTDPPYFGNVQYAELMDFCYVWLRRLVNDAAFAERMSTRCPGELTGNATMNRGLVQFADGVSTVFRKMARALKPGSPLVFTYHHNDLEAYYPIAIAILDARLVCTASLPSPAEMGASIHINRTGSSIVDTVFICRSTGRMPRTSLATSAEAVARLVGQDLEHLRAGGVKPTRGDVRCLIHGHLIRLAVWELRNNWSDSIPTADRLTRIARRVRRLGTVGEVERHMEADRSPAPAMPLALGGRQRADNEQAAI